MLFVEHCILRTYCCLEVVSLDLVTDTSSHSQRKLEQVSTRTRRWNLMLKSHGQALCRHHQGRLGSRKTNLDLHSVAIFYSRVWVVLQHLWYWSKSSSIPGQVLFVKSRQVSRYSWCRRSCINSFPFEFISLYVTLPTQSEVTFYGSQWTKWVLQGCVDPAKPAEDMYYPSCSVY
jgi:hypothetical protein